MWYFIVVYGIISFICNIKEINGRTIQFLQFDPELNVTDGAPMELKCTASQEIKSCAFEIPGLPKMNQANISTKNAQYEFLSSLEDGVCSIRVFKAKKEYQGEATCLVTYPNSNQGDTATTYIKVSSGIPPNSMQMTASNRYYEFEEGQEMTFVCTALHGTSPPNISIYLDDLKNYSSDLQSLTWSTSANCSHHNKKISCEVAHRKLGNAMTFSRSLTVFCNSQQTEIKTEIPNFSSDVQVIEEPTPSLANNAKSSRDSLKMSSIGEVVLNLKSILLVGLVLLLAFFASIALRFSKLCSGNSPKQSNVHDVYLKSDQFKSEKKFVQVPNSSKRILKAGFNNRNGRVVYEEKNQQKTSLCKSQAPSGANIKSQN